MASDEALTLAAALINNTPTASCSAPMWSRPARAETSISAFYETYRAAVGQADARRRREKVLEGQLRTGFFDAARVKVRA